MTPGFYERPGLNVETYDARAEWKAAGLDGDVEFYLRHARETGGPVLELGSGTGRVAHALGAAGLGVTGLELSEAMIAAAGAKGGRAKFVRGDMTDFALPERFGLAVFPFRSFQALLTSDAQRRCLACVRRHLRPGGRAIVNLFDPRLDWLAPGAQPSIHRARARHPVTGNEVNVLVTEHVNDPYAQTITERWKFMETDAAGRAVSEEEETLRLRWTYRHEMRHLLELCGFERVEEHGGFRGAAPAYGVEQVWVALTGSGAQG